MSFSIKILQKSKKHNFSLATLLNRYTRVLPNSKFLKTKEFTLTGVTIDDCAKRCNEQIGLDCKSFDFCYLNGVCSLSKESIDASQKDQAESDDNCDIYQSKYK
jgi:hypothetical protein